MSIQVTPFGHLREEFPELFYRELSFDIYRDDIVFKDPFNAFAAYSWESHSPFDGISEYKLDKYGKIYEHKVHNFALNGPQKSHVLALEQLIQSIGCPFDPKTHLFRVCILSDEKCSAIAEVSGDHAFLYLGSYQFFEIQDRKILEEHEACM